MKQPSFQPMIAKSHPLYSSVENPYRLFHCPPPNSVGVCHNCGLGCMSTQEVEIFLRGPAEQIPTKIIRSWYASAAPDPIFSCDIGAGLLRRIQVPVLT